MIDRRGAASHGGPVNAAGLVALGSRFGIGGIVIALLVVGLMYGRSIVGGGGAAEQAPARGVPANDEMAAFVGFVLDDNQQTWARQFAAMGRQYPRSQLVLFTEGTSTGCGYGQAAVGPFYCPADRRVYLDLGFFRELQQRFGARGDFAQAYVIAHEIGHHVQNVLGLTDELHGAPARLREGATGLSVRAELQADCLAGIWASSTARRNILEPGDVDEAMTAAAAIGDDRLQRQARGRVQPERWTHGSSEQRQRWFRRGYEGGTLRACDTASAPSL